jgi:hypothetical protein
MFKVWFYDIKKKAIILKRYSRGPDELYSSHYEVE